MTPCKKCGRVNPPEATYCMTCAANLAHSAPGEETHRDDFGRQDRGPASHPSAPPGDEHDEEGRFEKFAPLVEDFVFDMVRAGATLYFGAKDPNIAPDPHREGADARGRFERFKDAVAEARVEYRRRGQSGNSQDRGWR